MDEIQKLIHAQQELQKIHVMGSEAITYANAMIELTQAINKLQSKNEEA